MYKKRLAKVNPAKLLPLLAATAQAEWDKYIAVRALEEALGVELPKEAELEIFDLPI